MKKENIEDWKPYALGYGKNFFKKDNQGNEDYTERNIIYYERSWYCKDTGNIHNNEKQVLNCHYCGEKYYKPN